MEQEEQEEWAEKWHFDGRGDREFGQKEGLEEEDNQPTTTSKKREGAPTSITLSTSIPARVARSSTAVVLESTLVHRVDILVDLDASGASLDGRECRRNGWHGGDGEARESLGAPGRARRSARSTSEILGTVPRRSQNSETTERTPTRWAPIARKSAPQDSASASSLAVSRKRKGGRRRCSVAQPKFKNENRSNFNQSHTEITREHQESLGSRRIEISTLPARLPPSWWG